jgi:RNA polymerase-associated protein
MSLYEHPISSYAQKVKIDPREKALILRPNSWRTPAPAASAATSRSRTARSASTDRRLDTHFRVDCNHGDIEGRWPEPPVLARDRSQWV